MHYKQQIAYLLFVLAHCVFGFGGRVIGGREGSILEYPYQVSIQYDKSHVCGGAIIHATLVLTAAHCLINLHNNRLSVVGGCTLASMRLGEIRQVRSYKIHERYDDDNSDFDIGLIKIIGHFNFGHTLQPIPIANLNDPLPKEAWAIVTGWGFSKENGYTMKTLQAAKIPIVDRPTCRRCYKDIGTVTDNMICAGSSGRDACQGDSGGPLVSDGKVIGLVSWGYGCARPNYPGVYTNVAKFNNWTHINSMIM